MKVMLILIIGLTLGYWIGDFMVCARMLDLTTTWCEPVAAFFGWSL